jgi:hypothetical protein
MAAGVRVVFYLENRERTLDSPTDKIMLPGVLTLGVAGLGERFNASPAKVKRLVRELQDSGLTIVSFDATARLLYCRGAIEEDPPGNEQSTKAFPLEDCPPKCRGCNGHHPGLTRCSKLWDLEMREQQDRERDEREAEARANVSRVAADRGITEAEAREVLKAEQNAKMRAMLAEARAKLARR